jgi:hypothetical protein
MIVFKDDSDCISDVAAELQHELSPKILDDSTRIDLDP